MRELYTRGRGRRGVTCMLKLSITEKPLRVGRGFVLSVGVMGGKLVVSGIYGIGL